MQKSLLAIVLAAVLFGCARQQAATNPMVTKQQGCVKQVEAQVNVVHFGMPVSYTASLADGKPVTVRLPQGVFTLSGGAITGPGGAYREAPGGGVVRDQDYNKYKEIYDRCMGSTSDGSGTTPVGQNVVNRAMEKFLEQNPAQKAEVVDVASLDQFIRMALEQKAEREGLNANALYQDIMKMGSSSRLQQPVARHATIFIPKLFLTLNQAIWAKDITDKHIFQSVDLVRDDREVLRQMERNSGFPESIGSNDVLLSPIHDGEWIVANPVRRIRIKGPVSQAEIESFFAQIVAFARSPA